MRILVLVAMAAHWAGFSAGCASMRTAETQAESAPVLEPRMVSLLRGNDGMPLSWEELISAAAQADVVIIGEQHGHPLGLDVAATFFEDLVAHTVAASLSLEFFERDEQSRLDDYLAGLTDEATFRRRTGRTDGNYPEGHRRMLEAAKAAGSEVYAANAPRTAVRLARREGFDRLLDLTEEQRRLFRIPDAMPEGRYRDSFEELMTASLAHAHGVENADSEATTRMVEAMLRAQTLWDWTMAHTISRAVQRGKVPVVQVVGRFHSDFEGGLVQALESLSPGLRIMTVSMSGEWSDMLLEEDVDRADVVVYVGPADK